MIPRNNNLVCHNNNRMNLFQINGKIDGDMCLCVSTVYLFELYKLQARNGYQLKIIAIWQVLLSFQQRKCVRVGAHYKD